MNYSLKIYLNSIQVIIFATFIIDDGRKIISNIFFLFITIRIRLEGGPKINLIEIIKINLI